MNGFVPFLAHWKTWARQRFFQLVMFSAGGACLLVCMALWWNQYTIPIRGTFESGREKISFTPPLRTVLRDADGTGKVTLTISYNERLNSAMFRVLVDGCAEKATLNGRSLPAWDQNQLCLPQWHFLDLHNEIKSGDNTLEIFIHTKPDPVALAEYLRQENKPFAYDASAKEKNISVMVLPSIGTDKYWVYGITAFGVMLLMLGILGPAIRTSLTPSAQNPALASQREKQLLLGMILLPLAIIIRWHYIGQISSDYEVYFLPWYRYIQEHGADAFKDAFSGYPPLYTYLMWIGNTLAPDVAPFIVIRFISFAGEAIAAIYCFLLVRRHSPHSAWRPAMAAYTLLFAPTVLGNSFVLQSDILHTACLLAAIYHFSKREFLYAMLWTGVALSLKWQGLFIMPLVAVLLLRREMPYTYLIIPVAVYILSILPCYIAGRPFMDLLSVYITQFTTFHAVSYAATPYIFVNSLFYAEVVLWGLAYTAIVFSLWVAATAKLPWKFDVETLILLFTLSSLLMFFIMPKMHERYSMTATVFAIPLFYCKPSLWRAAVLFLLQTAIVSYLYIPHDNETFTPNNTKYLASGHMIYGLAAYSGALFMLVRQWQRRTKLLKIQPHAPHLAAALP